MYKGLIYHTVMGLMNSTRSAYLLRCSTAKRLDYCGDLKDTEQWIFVSACHVMNSMRSLVPCGFINTSGQTFQSRRGEIHSIENSY